MKRDKYWIEEGGEVAHKDNPSQKMYVERILKSSREIDYGDGAGNTSKKTITRTHGVECHWFDSEKKFQTGKFHTRELIPYEIAEQGEDAINKWVENN